MTHADATELVADLLAVPRDPRPPGQRRPAADRRIRRPDRRRGRAGARRPPEADLRRIGEYERANANRKTVLGGGRAQAGGVTARVVRWNLHGHPSRNHPPRPGRRARADRRHPRPRRQRGRAARRLRRVRRRRAAGRPGPRGGGEVQARLRRGARGRDPRAVARPHRSEGRPSRRSVAGARLSAPARGQGGAGRRRPAAHRQARRLRAGADRAGGPGVALSQQGGVLVRHRSGRRARLRLPRTGSLGRDRADDGLPAGLRALQRRARAGARLGAGAGARGLEPPRPAGPAAQPRRPRGPRARASCRCGS